MDAPLSPSRLANAEGLAPLPFAEPPTAKRRLVFEEDDNFFASVALPPEGHSMETEEKSDDDGEEDIYAFADTAADCPQPLVASSSVASPPALPLHNAAALGSRDLLQGVEEEGRAAEIESLASKDPNGKRRMVLEEDEDFGMEMDEPAVPLRADPGGMYGQSYTSTYSNLSAVNLGRTISLASVIAVTFDGSKVVFKRRKKLNATEESSVQKRDNSIALAKLSHSMLATPYHRMVFEIEKETALKKKQAEADASNGALQDSKPVQTDGALWTDRYRAKKFVDLLGDERVHRAALLWLKEWDQCVFKGAKTSTAAELKRERRKKRIREGKGGPELDENERAPDPLGRPHEKILLLSGPPGLGKTTLAHVLAHQAGYRVHEVNASDERTGGVVEQRIRNALESMAIGAGSNKPTCLVIDEIDGAAAGEGFVFKLAKLVADGSVAKITKTKGKGKEKRPLLRPIICICNNLYAPVLRPLRPISRIIKFSPPTSIMLVSRLRNICVDEGLGVDSKNLTLLAEVAEGDLRSCLNTLQFIKKNGAAINAESIRSTLVGKDMGISATTVVENLFKKPARKKGGDNSDERWVNRLEREATTCGEWDRISQGCFANYLSAKQSGDNLPRALETLDWLCFHEQIDKLVRSENEYSLWPYLPFAFVPLYKLFSTYTAKPLEFPHKDYEVFVQKQAYEEVATTLRKALPLSMNGVFSKPGIMLELLPFLNRIVAPDLKPINRQLIKAEERVVMLKLINTMLSMGLSYVQDKDVDGQLTYKLEPPIDVFVHFEGKRATDIPASRYAVRHLVAQEMHIEQMRRSNVPEGGSTTASDIIAAYKLKPTGRGVGAVEVKQAVDFFGRTLVVKSLSEAEAGPRPPPRAQSAVYRFHEGFSNAVRVTKRVVDFL